MKILFTSVGRRIELVQAFLDAARQMDLKIQVYGADISASAPALSYCHKKVSICRISDKNYIPQLLGICEKEKITLLIPTIDTDLLLLSQNKEKFAAVGTKVLISGLDKIRISRDKRYTAAYFESCGLKSPEPVDDVANYMGGFPCFIKPKDGSSSINAFRVEDERELQDYAKRVPDYIIQPFIEGEEYTIDIFCDFEGNPILITPRKRIAVRSGEVLKTQIVQDTKMIEESMRLIADYKPCGPITVQLIRKRETQEDYFIEINPRFGGGAPLSMKAGANAASALLRLLQGEELAFQENAARDGAVYSRFDQSISVGAESRLVEADVFEEIAETILQYKGIIFDLDDTLYFEKDYVKSGYEAVAKSLPEIKNASEKLWKAFLQGESAIDYVLKEEGFYSEERKEICLSKYRSHTPKISLISGVEALLESLKRRGAKVGIITDGRPDGQQKKLVALGLEQWVKEIIITDELAGNGNPLRFRKPNDIAFRIMKDRFNLPYSEMVYVGDNPEKDFIAPLQLGMGAVWFKNRNGLYWKK